MSLEQAVESEIQASGEVRLGDRYLIDPAKPLPDLDSPSSSAYDVVDEGNDQNDLFALISNYELPPRMDIIQAMRHLDFSTIMRPVYWGAIEWTLLGRRVFVTIIPKPKGGRVVNSLNGEFRPIRDQDLIEGFIAPLVGVVKEYSARGLSHRAIRPDNIYFADAERTQIILGENYMAPVAYTLPVMFETIGNGMCHPMARSVGHIMDDLYALGVTILYLFLGRPPQMQMNDDDLITSKIEYGSYAAIAGKDRIPRAIKEILRGLLADEESERWTLEDINLWLDGHRVSPQQPTVPRRASRPIMIGGKGYFTCRSLAHGLFINWKLALKVLNETDLENWVNKSVGDVNTGIALSTALSRGSIEEGGATSDMKIAWVIQSLDPHGPIRYKEFAAALDGLGGFLLSHFNEKGGKELFVKVIMSDLPHDLISNLYGEGVEASPFIRAIERIRYVLRHNEFGYGIERALYELNPSMYCLSPLIGKHFVDDVEKILPALEVEAAAGRTGSLPMDRHIAAYISVHFHREMESHFKDMSNKDNPLLVVLANLRVLAILQWRVGPKTSPALTRWMASLVIPVVQSFKNLRIRALVQDRIAKMVPKGSLVEILNLVDDPARRKKDKSDFNRAVAEYAAAEAEIAQLGSSLDIESKEMVLKGHKFAAMASLVLSILIILLILLYS